MILLLGSSCCLTYFATRRIGRWGHQMRRQLSMASRKTAIADLFDYIEVFYNRSRTHSTLGHISPKRFLAGWISSQHEQAVAA